MTDDAVADLDALDAWSDCLDPAGVFMAHDVREFYVNLAAPNAFDDMQIRATNARTADPHDHVCRARNFRIRYVFISDELFCRQFFIERMEHSGFHLLVSPRTFLFCGSWRGRQPTA